MMKRLLHRTPLLLALSVFSVGAAIVAQAASLRAVSVARYTDKNSSDFTVAFTDCVESIGGGLVPTDQAQALVPPEFHVVGENQPVTPIVVRTADCDIAVDDHRSKRGSVFQIGVVIVPPDFTGDINNYTLWYYTSDPKLSHDLEMLGINAQHVPTIHYDIEPSSSGNPDHLFVAVPRPGSPRLSLDGTVVKSETAAGSFEANWWVKTDKGTVKMDTLVPQIFIGGANLMLTTDANSSLGHLMGPSAGFAVLQQFNTFANASMKASLASH